jgi:hypothetical protein
MQKSGEESERKRDKSEKRWQVGTLGRYTLKERKDEGESSTEGRREERREPKRMLPNTVENGTKVHHLLLTFWLAFE